METFIIFVNRCGRMRFFETKFLEEADLFISKLDFKTRRKVLYNIQMAEESNDARLFKKLQHQIWEFRTNYNGDQIRLLAFWDKSDSKQTLVIATHGFIKKVDRVPSKEIERALSLRKLYFELK